VRAVSLLAIVLCAGCRKNFDDVVADAVTDSSDFDAAGCPAGYAPQAGLNSRYRVVLASPLTWLQAEAFCEADGTHLIVIDNATENAFARSFNGVDEYVWLGGGDHLVEGTFVWVTGQPLAFTRWGGAEPNSSMNSEDCMEIDENGLWNDTRNVPLKTFHVVCECDGVPAIPARYCDTDSTDHCGVCGNSCGGQTCTQQVCN
jgi:hypothetical protein